MTQFRLPGEWRALESVRPSSGFAIKWRIVKGELLSGGGAVNGTELPSVRALAAKYGSTRSTVMRVVEELVDEGILKTQNRSGVFVRNMENCSRYRWRSPFVGALVPPYLPYYQIVLRGMADRMRREGIHVLLREMDWKFNGFTECVDEAVGELKTVGLMAAVPKNAGTEALFQRLEDLPIPVVLVESDHPRLSSVNADDLHGFFLITRHLLELGHRRIAYLGLSAADAPRRHAGYIRALAAGGISSPSQWTCVESSLAPQTQWSEHAYRLICDEGVTAFACFNDDYAAKLIRYLRARGCRVPRDVSVAGFDNAKLLHPTALPLTTIDPQQEEMGRRAAEILLRSQERPDIKAVEKVVIIPKVVLGQSAAPLRS